MRRQKPEARSQKQRIQLRMPGLGYWTPDAKRQTLDCATVLFFLGWPLAAWAQSDVPLPSLETGALLIVHPICVHFAVALTVFGVGLDCIGSVRSEPSWQQAGRVCFFAGVGATGLAVLSGWIEQQLPRPTSLYDTQIQELLFYHEYLGYGLLGFFIVLMVARLQIAGRLPILFVMLSVLGLAGLVLQGYLGGELVYRYGAGVRAVQILSQQQLNEQKKAPE